MQTHSSNGKTESVPEDTFESSAIFFQEKNMMEYREMAAR